MGNKAEYRFPLRLDDLTRYKIGYWYKQADCGSRNEFITKAINFYADYLAGLDHQNENRPLSAMLAVTRLLHHMSRVFRDNSVPKSLPGGIRIDRKRLAQLREKKIAMGHKPDDHEEQWPGMTM